nr:serine/threonine-protein kinase chk1 [Quercus suber]
MCLELADGGDLFDKIEADEGVNENTAHMYFTQLINAIGWCHDKGVAHRDIKPENILLSGTGDLKLADFGLATQFQVPGREGKKTTMMVCGSPPYIAPEILAIGNVNLKRRKDEEKAGYCPDIADVWSCAIVLFVLLAGNTPWDLPVLEESYEYNEYVHSSGRPDDELWEKVPDHALDLLRAMLTVNPPDRLAISQVKTHAWYTRENPYVADRVALATSMLENMRVFNEDKPPSASQPQKPRASQRTDAMDVDRRSDAWAHLGVPDQPETPIAATPFDWQVAPPLGSQRFSQLGDASLTSHLADDPSMSQFSQTPAVPLRLTQQHDTTFTDILPAGSMTRLLSEWAPRQFLPLVLGALRALDVRLSAPPDTDDPDAPPRLPLAVRVKCLDGRRQPLHGTVVFERVAVLGRELLQLDFRKVRDLAGAAPDQAVEVGQQRRDRHHAHLAQRRVARRQHAAAPQDAHEPAAAPAVQLEHDLGAHAGPDHARDLEDGEQPGERAIVGDVVAVPDGGGAGGGDAGGLGRAHGVPQILRQLGEPDAIAGDAGGQRGGRVAVEEAVLVLAQAEDLVGVGSGDAVGGAGEAARQGLGVAQPGGEVIEVVVPADVPVGRGGTDAGEGVEAGEEGGGGGEVRLPGRRGGAGAVRAEEIGGGGAGVCRFEGVDAVGLDQQRGVVGRPRRIHAGDEHGGDLGRDDVVGHAVRDEVGIVVFRDEAEQIAVDCFQVCAVLVAVVQPTSSDLGELTSTVETFGGQGIGGGRVDAPVGARGMVAIWIDRLATVEEALVVTVPGVPFPRKCVGCIWSSLMVAMDDLNVLELVTVVGARVCRRIGVGHVAPVVRVQGSLAGIEDEAINTCAIDDRLQVVDLGLERGMPVKIHGRVALTRDIPMVIG